LLLLWDDGRSQAGINDVGGKACSKGQDIMAV
jgi:hypothetical protein